MKKYELTEELKQEAEEYAEGMAKYYASTHEDCIPSQFEKYLRNAYISSAEPREKQITGLSKHILELQKDKGNLIDRCRELEAQIEKMKNCKNCANYMISGKCPSFFKTGWCKNWEMTKGANND